MNEDLLNYITAFGTAVSHRTYPDVEAKLLRELIANGIDIDMEVASKSKPMLRRRWSISHAIKEYINIRGPFVAIPKRSNPMRIDDDSDLPEDLFNAFYAASNEACQASLPEGVAAWTVLTSPGKTKEMPFILMTYTIKYKVYAHVTASTTFELFDSMLSFLGDIKGRVDAISPLVTAVVTHDPEINHVGKANDGYEVQIEAALRLQPQMQVQNKAPMLLLTSKQA
jgi:hypothetical protein